MPVSTSPHRSDSEASAAPDRGEALIEEARQHARARRRTRAGIAIAVSIVAASAVAVGLAVTGSGSSPGERPGAGAGVPAAVAPAEEAELVTSWGGFHSGWVLVYADGRVIWYPDAGAGLAEGMSRYWIVERRLTTVGLRLVQSGAIQAEDFNRAAAVPPEAWAEPRYRPYVPAVYAVCHWRQEEMSGAWVDARSVLSDLPPAVRAMLRGTDRTFSGFSFLDMTPPGLQAPVTCFTLSAEATDDLAQLSYRPTLRYRAEGGELTFVDPARALVIGMQVLPVTPHGQFVLWGG